jgi:hypothetical protein
MSAITHVTMKPVKVGSRRLAAGTKVNARGWRTRKTLERQRIIAPLPESILDPFEDSRLIEETRQAHIRFAEAFAAAQREIADAAEHKRTLARIRAERVLAEELGAIGAQLQLDVAEARERLQKENGVA